MSAMSALPKVVTVIRALIGIITFLKHEIPDPKTPYDSTVRVAVALSNKAEGFKDAPGMSPMILAFNEIGQPIGASHYIERENIASGSWRDITIHQDDGPGQQATTLQLMSSDDGICIAYISQTWSDGATRGWLGDMGMSCGETWYYSNIIVGEEHHKPMCTWIDQNHSDPDDLSSGMQIYMEDFVRLDDQSEIKDDPKYYCRLPAMLFKYHHDYAFGYGENIRVMNKTLKWNDYTLWTGHEQYDAAPPMQRRNLNDSDSRPMLEDGVLDRSQSQRRNKQIFKHLVVSSDDRHSAQACCGDDKCVGPDILNPKEGFFCDQSTKNHLPLCGSGDGDEVRSHCYHWDTHSVVHANMNMRKAKEYSYIDHWD